MGRPGRVAHGECWCGCGGRTSISGVTSAARGYLKGEPRRYILGHIGEVLRTGGEGPNPTGLCMCGCGDEAPLAKYSYAKRGWVAGQAVRYIKGHHGKSRVPGYIETEHGCWLWQGAIDAHGYGRTKMGRHTIGAHRKVYTEQVGPIPEGHHLHHRCVEEGFGSKACVNPDHLELLTPAEHASRHAELAAA